MIRTKLKNKCYEISLLTVKLCTRLYKKREFYISEQILRSTTVMGVNIVESYPDEANSELRKSLYTALKEARKIKYWMRLLFSVRYINKKYYDFYICKINDICKDVGKNLDILHENSTFLN